MPKKLTTKDFIERSKQVHNDFYDYSKVDYKNMQNKVLIICPEHGEFEQLPQAHLRGQGCPICGRIKRENTLIEKYGVDNPMKCDKIKKKAFETSIKKYGHKIAIMNDDIREKALKTNLKKYGAKYPIQNKDIYKKIKQTNVKKYGVDNIFKSLEYQEEIKEFNLKRYGVEYPLSSEKIREKIKKTNQERYGGNAPMCSLDVQKKAQNSFMKSFGCKHPSQCSEIISKINDSKVKNHTYGKSHVEDELYKLLLEKFSKDDVIRQYKSEEYPFLCDFYIKSRDMYIELNGYWTHGDEWFDENNLKHLSILDTWKNKNTKHYENAINVWSVKDVEKRRIACENKLNYVVFWNNDLLDVRLWIGFGCPDAFDYKCKYSWYKFFKFKY